MASISHNRIVTMNRGDDFSFVFDVPSNIPFETYSLSDKDTLYVGVMEPNSQFECALIRKAFTNANAKDEGIEIALEANDTINLLPGLYYMQIKLRKYLDTKEGVDEYSTTTVLDKTKFIILD
jgi:hypothetical protein